MSSETVTGETKLREVELWSQGRWVFLAPSYIKKGDVFCYKDEPDEINIAMTDSETEFPYGVMVEAYLKAPDDRASKKSLMSNVMATLQENSGCCLDNELEKTKVATELLVMLSQKYWLKPR